MNDFPSIHLMLEYKSSPIHQAAVNKMESHKSDFFRQLFDAQIERFKTHVWWGSPARSPFDSLEDGEPRLFELFGRINPSNIRRRRMENSCRLAETSPESRPVEIVESC